VQEVLVVDSREIHLVRVDSVDFHGKIFYANSSRVVEHNLILVILI
jgi:hypothetical protein